MFDSGKIRTIWKYTLVGGGKERLEDDGREFYVDMPDGAEVLSVAFEGGYKQLVLWVLCDKDAAKVTRRFVVYGTGFEIDATGLGRFLGALREGQFVWHVFEGV